MEEGIAAAASTLSDFNIGADETATAAAAAAAGIAPNLVFDNSSMWQNFTSWTVQHLAFLNMTRLAPSLDDLVWAGPRMVMKLGKLGSFISFPDEFAQRVIPEATDAGIVFRSTTAQITSAGSEAAAAAANAATHIDTDSPASSKSFSLEGARGIGSVFSYATSRWALCCIVMAVVLNRTHIFAATRRRMRLRWSVRLLLRFMPIVLFLLQARRLLQSIQCQTSPDFAEMRWGNSSKSSELMFSQRNPYLHGLSSNLLLGSSDIDSCRSVRMVPANDEDMDLKGSLSLLWPLFGTFCLSQFLESVSCALQGRAVSAETWMTLFEHSLAFAEADAAISNQLGWGMFTSSSAAAANATSVGSLGTNIAISRQMIMQRVNTPPEVLLVAFISAMSHVTSHILGTFNKQARFRLLNTGFWALFFMASVFYSIVTFSVDDVTQQGLLRFPTVCIIGFIPHLLVLLGILLCIGIYGFAIGLSALAQTDEPGMENLSIRQRFARAHDNMQANVPLADIRINMEMDFYSALLRAGFGAITMASEAVYLNEDRRVGLKPHTWLEDDRFREIEEMRAWMGAGIPGSRFDGVGTVGLVPRTDGGENLMSTSGYARERVAQKLGKNGKADRGGQRPVRDGVGAAERSNRWLMALEYGLHVNRLIITSTAIYLCRVLAFVGIRNPPRFLRWLARRPKATSSNENGGAEDADGTNQTPNEWLIGGASGSIKIPRTESIDVERELRRRLTTHNEQYQRSDEREIDNRLYTWWLSGGWWGNTDTSGEYVPEVSDTTDGVEDDLTSIISASDAASIASDLGWESEPESRYDVSDDDLDNGQRTPTQHNHFASRTTTRESTPLHDSPMAMPELARLLNPRSPEEREQARTLAAHLDTEGIMTRSGYRRFSQMQRAEVLATSRSFGSASVVRRRNGATKMTPDEEAQVLEELLLSRRGAAQPSSANAQGRTGSWASGAAGMGSDGPQCVVCQSTARTIIVWPCRCLSLCDDCRVSLAMNNFDKCVCCRREVISFSRIFVP